VRQSELKHLAQAIAGAVAFAVARWFVDKKRGK
jgi:uncharacterized membrane-anchored protein